MVEPTGEDRSGPPEGGPGGALAIRNRPHSPERQTARLSLRRSRPTDTRQACVREGAPDGGAPEAGMPHLGTAGREHMLEEAVEKLDARQPHPAQRLGPVVAIAEGDLAGLDPLQPAVADRDAEHVPPQVVEHLRAATSRLAMHHPVRLPHGGWDRGEKPGLLQPRAHLGAEHRRQGLNRHQVGGVLRREPLRAIAGEPAGGDQQVHVRMGPHGPGPGVQHAQAAEAR